MEIVIKAVDGVLEFDAIQVITESEFAKINAGINQQRIVAWCTDNGSVAVCAEHGMQQPVCIMKQIENEVSTSLISETERKMHRFLEFVDELPEVDVSKEDVKEEQKEQSQDEIIEFATDTLAGLHNNDVTGAVLITSIGPIGIPCGKISHNVLTQMFETWLEKYGK